MTTPSPAGLSPLLDQLDEARAKGTPGLWAQHPADGEYVIGQVGDDDGELTYLDVADTYGFRNERGSADAACIVAEHNAIPQLTAAIRGVLARHHPRGRNIWGDEVCTAGHSVLEPWPCPDYVAICAALGHLPDCGDRSVGGCARPASHSGGHVAPSAYRPDAWAEDRERRTAALTPGADTAGTHNHQNGEQS